MSSILKELYTATLPDSDSPERHEVYVKQGKYYEKIRATLGTNFEDEFCGLVCMAASMGEEDGFTRGFRTCYQLFSELWLSKYSS